MATTRIRDAEATKQRLLEAAAAEFAQYGIAGARVDRIAAEAQSNKAQIYHYFVNKEGLFAAVFDELVADVLREVPLDADDLPGYAGRLFDGYEDRPDIARLATWHRLERQPGEMPLQAVVDSNQKKVDAIADAQARGVVSDFYRPDVLLGVILHAAAMWDSQTPEYLAMTGALTRADRRDVVVTLVAKITTPRK